MQINNIKNFMNFIDFEDKTQKTDKVDSFSNVLKNALNDVNDMQIKSTEQKNLLALGEIDNLHDLSIISEKAEIALQVTMSMKNKLVEAYKEIMRIQI